MGEMEGGQDHKVGGLGGKFKMSPGRGPAMLGTPAVCDPGGGVGVAGVPSGGGTRGEPMDTHSNAESLNRDGPQAAASLPGAQTQVKRTTSSHEPTFRHPSLVMLSDKTSGSKSENRLHRSDFPTSELENSDSSGGLSVSVSRGPLSDTQNKVRKESERVSPVERNCGVRPNVSITPISDSSLGDVEGSRSRSVTTTGIEIIPLGGQALTTGAGTQTKSKVRDFKRSLSEDDKRRLEKKEKRKREEKQRQGQESRSQTGATVTKLAPGDNSKLLGVIERLSYQSGDAVGLEIKPAGTRDKDRDRGPEPSVEITLDRLKPRTDKVEKPKLKLTIKTGAASTYDHIVSPNKLDTTFQIPKLFKADSPTHCRKEKSPSTSPKHSKPNKINERFITDPNRRTDDRKRSSEAPSSLSLHIVKSPVSSMSSSSISSLGDGIMEDSALLMQ